MMNFYYLKPKNHPNLLNQTGYFEPTASRKELWNSILLSNHNEQLNNQLFGNCTILLKNKLCIDIENIENDENAETHREMNDDNLKINKKENETIKSNGKGEGNNNHSLSESLEYQLKVDVDRCFGNLQILSCSSLNERMLTHADNQPRGTTSTATIQPPRSTADAGIAKEPPLTEQTKVASTTSLLNSKKPLVLKALKNFFLQYPWLFYYQGFHDIVGHLVVFVDDLDLVHKLLEILVFTKLSDFMHSSFYYSMAHLQLIPHVLSKTDAVLMKKLSMDIPDFTPHFAISWVMTWFLHDIEYLHTARLLMDLLICFPVEFPIYLSCSVLSSQREILLNKDEPVDYASLHQIFKSINLDQLLPSLLKETVKNMDKYPISMIIQSLSYPNSLLIAIPSSSSSSSHSYSQTRAFSKIARQQLLSLQLYLQRQLQKSCLLRFLPSTSSKFHHYYSHMSQFSIGSLLKSIKNDNSCTIIIDAKKIKHDMTTQDSFMIAIHRNERELKWMRLIIILMIIWIELFSSSSHKFLSEDGSFINYH